MKILNISASILSLTSKNSAQVKKKWIPKLLGLSFIALLSTGATANPVNPVVVNGSASIAQNGSQLTVTNTPGTIIDWGDFSIQNGELTRFIQQNGSSAVLNRVTGGLPSNILGELSSNGKVFLINPNGLLIGAGARIDTAGFLGSSLDISNEDFLAGRMKFSGQGGSVVNRGFIRAGKGGEVVLIAPNVENSGIIEAPNGQILLAAGREVTLTSLDDANISFIVQAPGDQVLNLGSLLAQNGSVRVFADQIFNQGSISADRLSQDADGTIHLEAGTQVSVAGNLSATGVGVDGGTIQILGDNAAVNSANINASGRNGGTVLIGGDYQGNGTVKNAQTTSVDAQTQIHADAIGNGDGGKVIVWSDGNTTSKGLITAMGGEISGNGGLVETSGKVSLDFGQPVDVSATNGEAGTWLLDPENITIGNGEAASISTALNGGSNVTIKTSDSGPDEGNITVNAPISKTQGPDAALTLDAHNRIDVNAPISSSEGKLNVSLIAGSDISVNAPITTNGGSFSTQITGVVALDEPIDEPSEESVASEQEQPTSPTNSDVSQDTSSSSEVVDQNEGVDVAQTAQVADTQPQVATPNNEAVNGETSNNDVPQVANQTPEVHVAPDTVVPPTITINNDVLTTGGDIHLNAATNGDIIISQSLDSSSTNSVGGDIKIEANRIALIGEAVVDASGEDGGEILIGGGQQGLDDSVQNAEFVQVDAGAQIHSDGGVNGDGGRVIVFANDTLLMDGEITAKGGSESGDGGFIETSGKRYLRINPAAVPDASAVNGQHGSWLIDPSNVIIANSSEINIFNSGVPGGQLFSPVVGGTSTVDVNLVAAALKLGGVTITTSPLDPTFPQDGDITLLDDLNLNLVMGTTVGDLTLTAANDIIIRASILGDIELGTLLPNLFLIANNQSDDDLDLISGDVVITGDDQPVTIQVQNDINISGVNARILGGDSLNLMTDGNVNINSNSIEFDLSFFNGDGTSFGDLRIAGGNGDGDNSVNLQGTDFIANADNVVITGADFFPAGAGSVSLDYTNNIGFIIEGDLDILGGTTASASAELKATSFDAEIGGDFNLQAGTESNTSALIDAGAVEMVVLGNVDLQGGSAINAFAKIEADGQVTIESKEKLSLLAGAGNGARADLISTNGLIGLSGDALILKGNGGVDSAASINTTTNITIGVNTDITLTAGTGGEAEVGIFANGNITNTVTGDLSLIAGDGNDSIAVIDAGGTLTNNVGGGITLSGGDGFDAFALLEGGTINNTSDTINITAGNGSNASALIKSLNGTITNTVENDVSLTGGAGDQSSAGISSSFGDVFNNIGGDLTLTGGVEGDDFDGESPPSDGTAFIQGNNLTNNVDGNVSLFGGEGDSASVSLIASQNFNSTIGGDLSLTGGIGNNSFVEVGLANQVDIAVVGDINIHGDRGRDSFAQLSGKNTVKLTSNTLTINGGSGRDSFAFIESLGSLDNTVAGDARLMGGSGENASATIFALEDITDTINGDLTLVGGMGFDAFASIESNTLDSTIGGELNLMGGVGAFSNAGIFTEKSLVIKADTINLDGGNGPGQESNDFFGAVISVGPLEDLPNGDNSADIAVTNDLNLVGGSNGRRVQINFTRQRDVADHTFDLDVGGDLNFKGSSSANSAIIDLTAVTVNSDIKIEGALNFDATLDNGDNRANIFGYGNGTITTKDLELAGGTIQGTGEIEATSTFDWFAGQFFGQGDLTTAGGSIDVLGNKNLGGRTWDQTGNVAWDGGDFDLQRGTLNNSGVFTANSDNIIFDTNGDTTFNNSGTFIKADGVGSTQIRTQFNNTGNVFANSGIIDFQVGFEQSGVSSVTDLGGGNLKVRSNREFEYLDGFITGSGTLEGDVDATSVIVSPGNSPGQINIIGDLMTTAATTFNIELGGLAPGEFDLINVTGNAQLAGTANVEFINGYNPVINPPMGLFASDDFDVITAGTTSGAFAAINVDPVGAGIVNNNSVNPASFNVSFTSDGLPVIPPVVPPAVAPPPLFGAPPLVGMPPLVQAPPVAGTPDPVAIIPPSDATDDVIVALFNRVKVINFILPAKDDDDEDKIKQCTADSIF